MPIQPTQLRSKAQQVLNLLGIKYQPDSIELTYVHKSGLEGVWQVNFRFRRVGQIVTEAACFSVSISTGEIKGMWTDRLWK